MKRRQADYKFGLPGLEDRRAYRIARRAHKDAASLRAIVRRRKLERRDDARRSCPRQHRWTLSTERREGSPICPRCGYTRAELGL